MMKLKKLLNLLIDLFGKLFIEFYPKYGNMYIRVKSGDKNGSIYINDYFGNSDWNNNYNNLQYC